MSECLGKLGILSQNLIVHNFYSNSIEIFHLLNYNIDLVKKIFNIQEIKSIEISQCRSDLFAKKKLLKLSHLSELSDVPTGCCFRSILSLFDEIIFTQTHVLLINEQLMLYKQDRIHLV